MTRSVPVPKPELLLYAPRATKYVCPAVITTGMVMDVKELHPSPSSLHVMMLDKLPQTFMTTMRVSVRQDMVVGWSNSDIHA